MNERYLQDLAVRLHSRVLNSPDKQLLDEAINVIFRYIELLQAQAAAHAPLCPVCKLELDFVFESNGWFCPQENCHE